MIDPAPEQIEAAQRVWMEFPHSRDPDNAKYAMRAALVAAAGAAPQEAKPGRSTYINPSLPGMIRNLWKSDPSEASVRTALGLAGDLIQELIDLRAAPQELSDSESEALKAAAQPYAHTFHRDGKAGLYIQIRNLPRIVAELRGGTQ